MKEKDITHQVGLKTAQLLKNNGYEVFLTRDEDTYLRLDDRTSQTNMQGIDLFVSIHANASKDKKVSGIETFCVQSALFENQLAMMDKHMAQNLQKHKKQLHSQSKKLAMAVQESILTKARQHNRDVIDRKVKFKPAQVLLGNESPSVLIELGFLSHPREGALLQKNDYQKSLAQGIYQGIVNFLQ